VDFLDRNGNAIAGEDFNPLGPCNANPLNFKGYEFNTNEIYGVRISRLISPLRINVISAVQIGYYSFSPILNSSYFIIRTSS
jgi:hypothetical protein